MATKLENVVRILGDHFSVGRPMAPGDAGLLLSIVRDLAQDIGDRAAKDSAQSYIDNGNPFEGWGKANPGAGLPESM